MSVSPKELIITVLRSAKGPISGADLAKELGVSGTAVWKHVQTLRKHGYEITGSTRIGYILRKETKKLVAEEVQYGLQTKFIGRNISFHEELDSTNQYAKTLVRRGKAVNGTVVLSEEQSRGKGRLGREWSSPKNGMWFTIILKPDLSLMQIPSVTLVVSEAVLRVLKKYGGPEVKIKWPNDILYRGRKLAGILCELEAEQDLVRTLYIGIGVNVNCSRSSFPVSVRNNIATLKEAAGSAVDRPELMRTLLKEIEDNFDQLIKSDIKKIVQNWRNNCETLGSDVKVKDMGRSFEGTAVDIDQNGALILKTYDGERLHIRSGDVIRKKRRKAVR